MATEAEEILSEIEDCIRYGSEYNNYLEDLKWIYRSLEEFISDYPTEASKAFELFDKALLYCKKLEISDA